MNQNTFAASARRAVAAAMVGALALTLAGPGFAKDPSAKRMVEQTQDLRSSSELSAALGEKWGQVLTAGYGITEAGVKQFVNGYASYPADVLKRALDAKNFEAMNRELMSHNQQLVNALAEKVRNEEDGMNPEMHKIKADSVKALGDEARDLVYIPIAPCRTFDTRSSIFSGFNGAVTPGNPKSAYVYWGLFSASAWVQYGGTVNSCPDTTLSGPLAGAAPYAVAFNLGIVTPSSAGWVTVYRGDLGDPSATVVSKLVQAGVNDTALVVANVCRGITGASCSNDIKIASQSTNVHVAGDVVGYFIKPQATALECTVVEATSPAATSMANNSSFQVNLPTCTTGHTIVGVGCGYQGTAPSGVGITESAFNSSTIGPYCIFQNRSGATQAVGTNLIAQSRCCRTPGR